MEKDSHILAEGLREGNGASYNDDRSIHRSAATTQDYQFYSQVNTLLYWLSKESDYFLAGESISKGNLKLMICADDLQGTMDKPTLAIPHESFPTAKFMGFVAVVKESEIQEFWLEPVLTFWAAFESAHLTLILNNHSLFFHASCQVC